MKLSERPAFVVSETLWRSLQTLNIVRVLLAVILIFILGLEFNSTFWIIDIRVLLGLVSFYFFCSLLFIYIKNRWKKRFLFQLMSQIAIDLVVISILYLGSNGGNNGIVILYFFPLAGVGILAPLTLALFSVSSVALFLLLVNFYEVLRNENSSLISQAGIYGGTFFAVVLVLNRLAKNLLSQEELAKKRGRELKIQQSINHSIIEDMEDGVLVVDQFGSLREFNPSANRMLGLKDLELNSEQQKKLEHIPALSPIFEALLNWNNGQRENSTMWFKNEGDAFVVIKHANTIQNSRNQEVLLDKDNNYYELETHLKLRFVQVGENVLDYLYEGAHQYTLVFMQDVSDIENQAQQLKLASMGRLTASIAHEVRNPLASISYAASLLNEDLQNEVQAKRLIKIVEDNVMRLNQLIEDILKLSRKAQVNIEAYYLMDEVNKIVQEFIETKLISPEIISVIDTAQFKVTFDPDHLREVVTNLLSNALRYASSKPGSIRLYAQKGLLNRRELHIQDDGPGIKNNVRAHLFEPFYTTSSKGTGLGLYMARELCLNNSAILDYEFRNDESSSFNIGVGGRFVVIFSSTGQE